MLRLFVSVSILISVLVPQVGLASEMTQFLHMPSTINGPTGLLITQSIDTLPPKKFGVGLGFSTEESDQPQFKETQALLTGIVGLTPTVEASLQVPYLTDAQFMNGKKESGVGDASLSLKWRFMDASPDLNFPGFALSLTAFLPTGDPKKGVGAVDAWGLKALIVSSAEAEISLPRRTVLMGFYANGGIYMQDSGDPTEEKHGIINLGILVPLSDTKQVQLLLEGNGRVKREKPGIVGESDYSAGTLGLRYVRQNVTLTGGWQRKFNDVNQDNTNRLLFHGTYGF